MCTREGSKPTHFVFNSPFVYYSVGGAPKIIYADECSDIPYEAFQHAFLPMLGGVGERVLVGASTAKGRHNWWDIEMEKSRKPGSKVQSVEFNFRVCTDCREEGKNECEHALLLYPPWYDPEKAKEVHAVANQDAMREMLGLQHDDNIPAFKAELVEKMVSTFINVPRVSGTIVVGLDPNSGGMDSKYAFMATTVIDNLLVILGFGVPDVVCDVVSDPNHAFRIFVDFLNQLFDRYGRGCNLLISVESNTAWHVNQLYEYVDSQPFSPRIDWIRESGREDKRTGLKKLGIYKDHAFTCRTQQLWHTWMHEGVGVAENAVWYTGGVLQGPGRLEYTQEELRRQFLQYEQLVTKTGFTYGGKVNGPDDGVCAGLQNVAATHIVTSGERRSTYPMARFPM